jgi:hypothetical protein
LKIFNYSTPGKIFSQTMAMMMMKLFLFTNKILKRKRDGRYLIATRADRK